MAAGLAAHRRRCERARTSVDVRERHMARRAGSKDNLRVFRPGAGRRVLIDKPTRVRHDVDTAPGTTSSSSALSALSARARTSPNSSRVSRSSVAGRASRGLVDPRRPIVPALGQPKQHTPAAVDAHLLGAGRPGIRRIVISEATSKRGGEQVILDRQPSRRDVRSRGTTDAGPIRSPPANCSRVRSISRPPAGMFQ